MSKLPILILGNGQVGKALKSLLKDNAILLSRAEADLADLSNLNQILSKFPVRAVINAAAYTQVDKAEQEEELANIINAEAPAIIATYCQKQNIPFIHYSTDYVFSGSGDGLWEEADTTSPLSAYGRSKLLGEKYIEQIGSNYLIFRTSWVYDKTGKNFLTTMEKLGQEKEVLQIVNDQIGAPTYAKALAQATLDAIENASKLEIFPRGLYHLCGSGHTSWYGFAEAIFHLLKQQGLNLKVKTLAPISSNEYKTVAKRPLNSRLNCNKAKEILKVVLPSWQDSLQECIKATNYLELKKNENN
jgi:dTDP-4-dehydrorhamnose reductase